MPEPDLKARPVSQALSDFLKQNKLDPDKRRDDRGTAIHLAVLEEKHGAVAELLALYREDCLNARDKAGKKKNRTPLQNAAQLGFNAIVTTLLESGADVNAKTKAKWTALILASQAGQAETVKILLKHNVAIDAQAEIARDGDRAGLAAIHVAAELKSPATLLQLLWHGARVDVATADGDTPLHCAVKARCGAAISFLRFHGASMYVTNRNGESPRDLIYELLNAGEGMFKHHLNCWVPDANQQFITCIDGDKNNPDLPRAIHRAVEKDLRGAVIYLLHMDPYLREAKSPGGLYRPLHVAAKLGLTEQILILVNHGAEVNCKARRDWTPLMLAAEHGHGDAVRTLLQCKANVMLKNKDGNSAALLAMKSGLSIPGLLPTFRHVPSDQVPRLNDKPVDNGKKLPVPDGSKNDRAPSPGWNAEPEAGELYALSDATRGEASNPSPKNAQHVKKLFSDLERTWYEKIQWSPEDDRRKSHGPDWSGPVKIAILDTGIDLEHEDFQRPARRTSKLGNAAVKRLPEVPQRKRIKAYRNFVGGPGEEEDVSDLVGHGTHIAGIILSTVPRAELYIAKTSLGEDQQRTKQGSHTEEGVRRKTRRPVQEALQWAIEQGVDIINLSLGFSYESSYDLTNTLEEANHKGIIVFAAAANHSNREAIAWPARDRDLAICVTSGDELGNLSRFAPSGNKTLPVFITHGEDVWSQWPTKLGGGFRPMSGTSVATPIAVGMAAMILAFLNTTSTWSPEQKRQWLDRSKERRLRSTRGMGRLLEHICRDRNGLRILSPKLMWEDDPDARPLYILSLISLAFRLPG
ncbi:hypothetical protein QQS21_007927 [Conoideocrella luteorostrata]|uniref:Peptidase S8/S53 domain-containing protein n=1 Tax=Conoideocrella luteorostrata TaxID=1105319 RepID=A0AAJ0CML5_9HYPO|nr:hypothetical protein QQS21_007927 [Conoideocrella luteorostrata]